MIPLLSPCAPPAWMPTPLPPGLELATGWLRRLRGWCGRRALAPRAALCLHPCAAVHTLGMRLTIDVVFLDAAGRVLHVVEALPPGRLAWWRGARSVLELPRGAARRRGVRAGTSVLAAFADRSAA